MVVDAVDRANDAHSRTVGLTHKIVYYDKSILASNELIDAMRSYRQKMLDNTLETENFFLFFKHALLDVLTRLGVAGLPSVDSVKITDGTKTTTTATMPSLLSVTILTDIEPQTDASPTKIDCNGVLIIGVCPKSRGVAALKRPLTRTVSFRDVLHHEAARELIRFADAFVVRSSRVQ